MYSRARLLSLMGAYLCGFALLYIIISIPGSNRPAAFWFAALVIVLLVGSACAVVSVYFAARDKRRTYLPLGTDLKTLDKAYQSLHDVKDSHPKR